MDTFKFTTKQIKRFWQKVKRASADKCWEWQGRKTPAGYGNVKVANRFYAHRIAYEMITGEIPEGLHVMHSCDNPCCCNPNHLSVGTALDNMRDRDIKGRNGKAKLTNAQVLSIREQFTNGKAIVQIATEMGLQYPTVFNVAHSKTFKYLPPATIRGQILIPGKRYRFANNRVVPDKTPDSFINQIKALSGCDMVREIPGYPLYAVTDDAQVWSAWGSGSNSHLHIKPHKMGLIKARRGYIYKLRNKQGKMETMGVSKVLALAFLGEPPSDEYQARFKEHGKTHADNVIWKKINSTETIGGVIVEG